MKIILSRKGFDSTYGRVPSPIFPDGRMVSFPIGDKASQVSYREISAGAGRRHGDLVEDLTAGRVKSSHRAHLDPDLVRDAIPRSPGWRPIFGQEGAAQSHLRKKGVGASDLFLYFGWFREVVSVPSGGFRYRKDGFNGHALFGWLQVDRVVPIDYCGGSGWNWARYHPHFHHPASKNNVLYVARECLALPGKRKASIPGAGTFGKFRPGLELTAPGSSLRSRWRLPRWFHPGGKRSMMSYHENQDRWELREDGVILRTVARGQEFVLDVDDYPEAIEWVVEIISHGQPRK